MFYCVYKITNTLNGKIYIGLHKTDVLEDNYLGSGKLIRAAIKKHGAKNFVKEVLFVFDNEQSMIEKEIEIVTEEFCNRSDVYNIMPGGKYGSGKRNGLSFKGRVHSDESKELIRKAALEREISDESRSKMVINNFARRNPEEQKEHARKAASGPKSEAHKEALREAWRKKKLGGKSIEADTSL